MELCHVVLLCFTLNAVTCFSLPGREEEERKVLGERKFQEIIKMSEYDLCWKKAVLQLKSRCKSLSDIEQSRLAVAFANCHLQKSGRKTYFCDDTMSIKDCTMDMNSIAFQTYTEFFTHTGHICYFLQNLLWQEKAESVIFQLSETSSLAVKKLQTSLEHHKNIEKKQNEVLDSFTTMKDLAQKQRDLLWEVYSNLKISIESVRYITSLFLIELVGIETFVVAVASWVVIYFLPRYNYSRFWLNILLISEQAVEIIIRRAYGKMVRESTDDVTTLYSWIWACRYMALCLGLAVYFFNWLKHSSPVHRNMVMLKEIQRDIRRLSHRVSGAVMESFLQTAPDSRQHTRMENHGTQKSDTTQSRGSFTKAMSVHSEPPLSPSTNWRMNKYLKSLPSRIPNEHFFMEDVRCSDSRDNSDTTWRESNCKEQFQESDEQMPYRLCDKHLQFKESEEQVPYPESEEQVPYPESEEQQQQPSKGDTTNHLSESFINIGNYSDLEPGTSPQSDGYHTEKEVNEEKNLPIIKPFKRRPPSKNHTRKQSQMRKQSIVPPLDTGVDINYFVESPEKLYRLLQTIPCQYLKPHLYNLRSAPPGGYNLRPRSNS